MRLLFLAHRYLGIALGLMMLVWCLSGFVMMYMPYPALGEAQRVAALKPLDWRHCCVLPPIQDDTPVEELQIEMLGDGPVLRLELGGGPRLIDLTTGDALDAAAIARRFASTAVNLGPVDRDQWTVDGGFNPDRPLLHFAAGDPAGIEFYVSSRSGRVVQVTTARQRFWNWFGAVPHWLYFTPLRAHPAVWAQVVDWTALFGCLLAVSGLTLGLCRFGRWRQQVGVKWWHHLPGLIWGVFAVTWIASGLISMNPWGFLDSGDDTAERRRIAGPAPAWSAVSAALPALEHGDARSITLSRLAGRPYFIVTRGDGARSRLDATGATADLSPAEIGAWFNAEPTLLTEEDDYYFSHHLDTVRLPVYRIIASGTRYYVDPVSGRILAHVDRAARWYRWLHQGLHRLDLLPLLRRRPLWDLVMLALLGGVTLICATGTWLGIRRLTSAGLSHPCRGTRIE